VTRKVTHTFFTLTILPEDQGSHQFRVSSVLKLYIENQTIIGGGQVSCLIKRSFHIGSGDALSVSSSTFPQVVQAFPPVVQDFNRSFP
jgi:hypothetical protein